jgi:DNA-binding NtrC family response regulator
MDDAAVPSGLSAAEVERRLILQTLDETGNNKAETARRLGLNVKTIRNKLRPFFRRGWSPRALRRAPARAQS